MKKNYESMAASNQSQVEMLQDKIITEFCRKAGQIAQLAIDQAKRSEEMQIGKLAQQVNDQTQRSCL
jgi:hypothetical protein